MSAKAATFTTFGTTSTGEPGSAIAAILRGRFAEASAAWKARREVARVIDELAPLSDRMLQDIGITAEEIARLRAGDRFMPGRYMID